MLSVQCKLNSPAMWYKFDGPVVSMWYKISRPVVSISYKLKGPCVSISSKFDNRVVSIHQISHLEDPRLSLRILWCVPKLISWVPSNSDSEVRPCMTSTLWSCRLHDSCVLYLYGPQLWRFCYVFMYEARGCKQWGCHPLTVVTISVIMNLYWRKNGTLLWVVFLSLKDSDLFLYDREELILVLSGVPVAGQPRAPSHRQVLSSSRAAAEGVVLVIKRPSGCGASWVKNGWWLCYILLCCLDITRWSVMDVLSSVVDYFLPVFPVPISSGSSISDCLKYSNQ